MAVLKQTSPTAWPSAPRPKPSSTVPSASTRSAVGLWSGQAEAFSEGVMNALHSRRMRLRQSRNRQIHMQNPHIRAGFVGIGAVAGWFMQPFELSDRREPPRSGTMRPQGPREDENDAARKHQ